MAEHHWTDPETHLPCLARDEPSGEMCGPMIFRAFGVAGIAGRELLRLARENERLASSNAFQDDLVALLRAAGLPDHARPASPRQVVQEELLPEVQRLAARERVLSERVTDLERQIEEQSAVLDASDKLRAISSCAERSRLRQGIDNEILRYGPDSYCRIALRTLRDRLVPEEG